MSGPADPLIPPRPNPGPEPWTDPVARPWWPLPVGLALAALVAWRSRVRAPVGIEAKAPGDSIPEPPEEARSPRDRWIAASSRVREALVDAFGPALASRTTEELAADRSIRDRLGADRSSRLVAFLERADLAKFSGVEPNRPDAPEDWAEALVRELSAIGPDV